MEEEGAGGALPSPLLLERPSADTQVKTSLNVFCLEILLMLRNWNWNCQNSKRFLLLRKLNFNLMSSLTRVGHENRTDLSLLSLNGFRRRGSIKEQGRVGARLSFIQILESETSKKRFRVICTHTY